MAAGQQLGVCSLGVACIKGPACASNGAASAVLTGSAWKTLIQHVGDVGVSSCRELMMVGKAWPSVDGHGSACERTLIGS